uniref:BPH_3 domain-containing protein n=1 Tax=Panagrellus redivivus TaxID=6233 RepID=A0A7E4VUD4_PANRE
MTDNNEPENSTISHNIEALPFADLPYEFKERLAQLLPRGVLATLARTGHEAALLAFPHIRFVKQLRVSAQSQSPYLKISINKTHFVDYDVKTETREFYITRKLTLNLHSRRAFNKVYVGLSNFEKNLHRYPDTITFAEKVSEILSVA